MQNRTVYIIDALLNCYTMRIQLVRIIALVWFVGTLYISFRLFSTKTSFQNIGLADVPKTLPPRNLPPETFPPATLPPKTLRPNSVPSIQKNKIVPIKKAAGFNTMPWIRVTTKAIKQGTNRSQGWEKYRKYKNIGGDSNRIWPKVDDEEDRVINQIHATPFVDSTKPPKLILMKWGLNGVLEHRDQFIKDNCPINWCTITQDLDEYHTADLVFYKDYVHEMGMDLSKLFVVRNPNQVSMLFMLESPWHNSQNPVKVNWTASYRSDSVINAPYERFTYFSNFTTIPRQPIRNFAQNKTKKVAWFVSNCYTTNGRLAYTKELSKYIDVDIYGGCGTLSCPREMGTCGRMLKEEYKFYLSFENSNCQDYITEKFFVNALSNDILPIVMGARPEDYEKLAPPKSYIHVDEFESPKDLAEYLHKLDQNDDLYNSYFLWKGIGELIDTKFWCRVCSLLHERGRGDVRIWYDNVQDWWNGAGVCQRVSPLDTKKLTWSSWKHRNVTASRKEFHFVNSSSHPGGS